MAVTYPGTVPNWHEYMPGPDVPNVLRLHAVLKLLFQTFPGRYEKLSVLELLNKMVTRPIKTDQVPVLRIWYHTPAAQEMAALFFLRGVGKKAPVYAMTVGLNPAFNDTNAIYTELLPLCTFMATQVGGGLEILNESPNPAQGNPVLTDVIDNLANTAGHQKVAFEASLAVGGPWPNNVYRWKVDPNA